MSIAHTVLQSLRLGNQRFIANLAEEEQSTSPPRHYRLIDEQSPFAVVISCSDSRVSPEIIFDQGIGDLFVVRVAGNVITPTQIGSVEFAVEHFKTLVVIILGHLKCGAVKATLEHLQNRQNCSAGLASIVDAIQPAVQPVFNAQSDNTDDEILTQAVRANTLFATKQLCENSTLLKRLVEEEKLFIIAAEYDLDSGRVIFIEDDQ